MERTLKKTLSAKALEHLQKLTYHENNLGPSAQLYEDSWKLVITSTLFMVPAIVAFSYNMIFLAWTSFITSFVAINYWRDAKFGWRRWIDMTVAKTAFIIYLYHAVMYARSIFFGVVTAVITSTMVYVYTNVSFHIAKQSKSWIKYHAAFHCLVILGKLLIILEMV